jgi:hypothetical protein
LPGYSSGTAKPAQRIATRFSAPEAETQSVRQVSGRQQAKEWQRGAPPNGWSRSRGGAAATAVRDVTAMARHVKCQAIDASHPAKRATIGAAGSYPIPLCAAMLRNRRSSRRAISAASRCPGPGMTHLHGSTRCPVKAMPNVRLVRTGSRRAIFDSFEQCHDLLSHCRGIQAIPNHHHEFAPTSALARGWQVRARGYQSSRSQTIKPTAPHMPDPIRTPTVKPRATPRPSSASSFMLLSGSASAGSEGSRRKSSMSVGLVGSTRSGQRRSMAGRGELAGISAPDALAIGGLNCGLPHARKLENDGLYLVRP